MQNISVIMESKLLREVLLDIIKDTISNVVVSTISSLEQQKIYQPENIGDLLFIDVEANVDVLKAIKFYQDHQKKVIVWTSGNPKDRLQNLFLQRVDGYFYSGMEKEEIISAILMVQEGEVYIHPRLSPILLDAYIKKESTLVEKPKTLLTQREWEILELLTKGYSNDEISYHLEIKNRTVKNHVSSLLKKLNATSRTNAVSIALKNRWF
ncbi:response regulator transcription factor [Lederbergia graminis]|uniref:Response regulator transcription factor n=1 Tax=Lederbergia graminis TaxID=735518 RepID=A0ABW0LKX2_9BACI